MGFYRYIAPREWEPKADLWQPVRVSILRCNSFPLKIQTTPSNPSQFLQSTLPLLFPSPPYPLQSFLIPSYLRVFVSTPPLLFPSCSYPHQPFTIPSYLRVFVSTLPPSLPFVLLPHQPFTIPSCLRVFVSTLPPSLPFLPLPPPILPNSFIPSSLCVHPTPSLPFVLLFVQL